MSESDEQTVSSPGPCESADDLAYAAGAFQFAADRLGELVHASSVHPLGHVPVSHDVLNKLYLAYLGALELAKDHMKSSLQIEGRVYVCSEALQQAVAPFIHAHYLRLAEEEVRQRLESCQFQSQVLGQKRMKLDD